MHRNATQEIDNQIKDAESAFSKETLHKIHDEIAGVRRADKDLSAEMNRITIVCEPPPVTPRCHPVELPPNPFMVHVAMGSMIRSAETLQKDIDSLRPLAFLEKDQFTDHLDDLSNQMTELTHELDKLKILTGEPDDSHDDQRKYDRSAILKETEAINSISKIMEKTRKKLEKDMN